MPKEIQRIDTNTFKTNPLPETSFEFKDANFQSAETTAAKENFKTVPKVKVSTKLSSVTVSNFKNEVSSPAWFENFISGASASLLSKLILQPLDTTRTILQGSPAVRGEYKNLSQCLTGMIRNHGFMSLYRGFMGSIIVSAPSSAIFFSSYEYFTNAITSISANPNLPFSFPSPLIPLLSSSLGNVVSSTVRSPPEIVKQRVQAGFYDNMITATVNMLKDEGILSFFKGYTAMICRDIPYAATQFSVFEFLKKRRKNTIKIRKEKLKYKNNNNNYYIDNKTGELSDHEILLSNIWIGAFAGLCASVLTSPIDVVKTRVMTQQVMTQQGMTQQVSLNMREMFLRIWAEEGIQGFGRGLAPRILYKVPSSAVFLVCYEGSKQIFQKIRETKERKSKMDL